MVFYIDTSVFYHAYSPIEHAELADWVLDRISPSMPACTSEWTIVEMFRAFKKQVNLKKLVEEDAQKIIDHFLAEIHEWQQIKALFLIPVEFSNIIEARDIIFGNNLYAADAIHFLSAIKMKATAFLTFDKDFHADLKGIAIINQNTKDFQEKIDSLRLKSKEN
jgi:predicted nucleic acid-binding protein